MTTEEAMASVALGVKEWADASGRGWGGVAGAFVQRVTMEVEQQDADDHGWRAGPVMSNVLRREPTDTRRVCIEMTLNIPAAQAYWEQANARKNWSTAPLPPWDEPPRTPETFVKTLERARKLTLRQPSKQEEPAGIMYEI